MQEFGGCHETTLEDSGEFDWDQAEAETVAEERRQAALAQQRELWRQQGSTAPERARPFSESTESWALVIAGCLMLFGGLLVWAQSSFKQGMTFATMGLLGSFVLWHALIGLLSGVIETMSEDSSEQIVFRENPIRFLINLVAWSGTGVFLCGLAWSQLT